jgi:hypothetical protein
VKSGTRSSAEVCQHELLYVEYSWRIGDLVSGEGQETVQKRVDLSQQYLNWRCRQSP